MAKQKYNWKAIKKDYYDSKYPNLVKLAEAYNMSYPYLKKRAAKWSKDAPELISDLDIQEAEEALRLPEDRKEKVRLMYDKFAEILFRAISNPDQNFFTLEGTFKSKQFLDAISAMEKIDKGYETGEESKQTGQLGIYADYMVGLRQQYLANKKEEDNQDE